MPDVVRVNSTIYSWESTILKLDNTPWTNILSIDHEQKRERKVVHGMRLDGTPLGKTRGKYTVPAFNMKFLVDSYDALTSYLVTKTGSPSYGDAEFTITLQVVDPNLNSGKPLTTVALNCTIDGEKESKEEGIDESLVEVAIGCLKMTKNGKTLFSYLGANQ